jgi:PEP-CTERM motif
MNLSYNLPTPAGSVSGSSNNSLNISASARGEYNYRSFQGYDYSKPDYYNYPIYSTTVVPATEQTLSNSRQFYAVFANTSNSEQTAYFNIGAQISGRATTALPINLTPVPEPGTWALALVGLGLVGAAVRRRAS